MTMTQTSSLEQAIRASGAMRCLECGKCTAICPVVRFDGGFSPRVTVGRALVRRDQDLLCDDRLWTCLNCLQCSQVCPANVDYSSLTTTVRSEARRLGEVALCTHGEAIHVWMRLMTEPGIKQNRLEWIKSESTRQKEKGEKTSSLILHPSSSTSPLATSTTSDTLYFVGCAPYYDALFKPLGVSGTAVAHASVRVLNAMGIEPQVLPDERCCGHDLLWEGDIDRFLQLARLNAEMIRASRAKRIVSSCPECVRTLKVDYPAHGIRLNAQIVHLSEMLATSLVPSSRSSNHDIRVTFHDPCRLGRHLGIYDPPRRALEQLGYQVVEMRHSRRNATCCGTNGWTHCGAANKAIQVQRLSEAKATGADLLVTACLKCQIHFKCALQDEELKDKIGLEMIDLAELAALSIES
jgi:heterodisulfide reductase subunit D